MYNSIMNKQRKRKEYFDSYYSLKKGTEMKKATHLLIASALVLPSFTCAVRFPNDLNDRDIKVWLTGERKTEMTRLEGQKQSKRILLAA